MYAIVPCQNGMLDIDYHDLIQAIDNGDGTYTVHLKDNATPRESWQLVTENVWATTLLTKVPQPPAPPPDPSQLLGQFIVQQTLKNAELEQALNAIGAGIVQLQLAKGGA
jgi:hypothetical protein